MAELAAAHSSIRKRVRPDSVVEYRESDALARYGTLLFSELMSDVVFAVGEYAVEIPAHRLVLGLGSHVFRSMLCEERWRLESHGAKECLPLPGDAIGPFRTLLTFLYTGRVELTPDTTLPALEIARKYDVESLGAACRSAIGDFMKPDNVLALYASAVAMDDMRLQTALLKFIDDNATAVFATRELENAEPGHFLPLLSRDSLAIKEVDLLAAICRWLASASTRWDAYSAEVVGHVRLALLTEDELLGCVRSSGLVASEVILDTIQAIRAPRLVANSRRLVPDLPTFPSLSLEKALDRETIRRYHFEPTPLSGESELGIMPEALPLVNKISPRTIFLGHDERISDVHCLLEVLPTKGCVRARDMSLERSLRINGESLYPDVYVQMSSGHTQPAMILKDGDVLSFPLSSADGVPSYTVTSAPMAFRPRRSPKVVGRRPRMPSQAPRVQWQETDLLGRNRGRDEALGMTSFE